MTGRRWSGWEVHRRNEAGADDVDADFAQAYFQAAA
jgi:hypothetical protein